MIVRNSAFTIILNPCAGAGRGREYQEAIASLTYKYGGELLVSRSPGHTIQLANMASTKKRSKLIFAAGGDDTVREVLMGIAGKPMVRLGVVPVGTFNNFATSLNLPEDPMQALEEAILGVDHRIDLGKIENGHYFIESVGIGLDSEAWSRAPKEEPIGVSRWFTGLKVGFLALAAYLPKKLNITIDNTCLGTQNVMQVIIANSRCFGSRIQIAPKASLDDGLLDVCLIPPMSKARFLALVPFFFYGNQLEYIPSLRYYQCKKITISAKRGLEARVDGMLAGKLPITVRSLGRALPIRLPASCLERVNGELQLIKHPVSP